MRRNDTADLTQRELMLDSTAAEHAGRVRDYLLGEIDAAGGWLSFERFMDLALYAPGLGYYSSGAQKLGSGGDFITAPELSALFGACVAVQCAEILSELRTGCILEIGAGSGRLAADILARLESSGKLPHRYWILEVSADLRQRQRHHFEQHLPHLLDRVEWLDMPPQQGFDGVVLANEVLDALPVARFRWHGDAVQELGIVSRAQRFAWESRPASEALTDKCRTLMAAAGAWEDGYISEYCPRLAAFAQAVTRPLRRGAVFWFDYGLPRAQYYLPERHEGTLIGHFRHRTLEDVLFYPGLADITAWVDFTALAEASRSSGFDLAGFTTQAHFLAGTGIDAEMQRLAASDDARFARLASEARQLMLPGEMGERFKAMAWLRKMDRPLSGFALLDLRHTL
jgi:SAM-dependent MidA family methyltransferase